MGRWMNAQRVSERRTYGMEDCMAFGVIVDIVVVVIMVGGVWDATGVAARRLKGSCRADAEQLGVRPNSSVCLVRGSGDA